MSSGHADFQTIAVMRGVYAGEQITLAVDALGRLRVLRINISDLAGVHGDLDGLDADDHPQYRLAGDIDHGTLLGLDDDDHPQYRLAGDIDHGTLVGLDDDDHPQYRLAGDIDHGTLVGLADYDHDQYVRKNLSQALEGQYLHRENNAGGLLLEGGLGGEGTCAVIGVYGADHDTRPGWIIAGVPNAAKNMFLEICRVVGVVDAPVTDWRARRLTNLADPTAAQDAVTIAYLEAHAGGVDSGLILAWSGSIASIPAGYVLCNGANGTPNLRDRFIVGAGNLYAVNATGGKSTHILSESEMPSHTHHVGASTFSTYAGGTNRSCPEASDMSWWENAARPTGGGLAHENKPPYLALAWVKKT